MKNKNFPELVYEVKGKDGIFNNIGQGHFCQYFMWII